MSGKTVIITGASAGIGLQLARILCEKGYDVILACRNETKAKAAITMIKAKNSEVLATYMHLDLADKSSIEAFVSSFKETGKNLHALVNNAGIFTGIKNRQRQVTKDNFEVTVGTNYLGHFYLTHLLLDLLKMDDEGACVVNVTSALHDINIFKKVHKCNLDVIDLENFLYTKKNSFNGSQAYKDSCTAIIMASRKWSETLKDSKVRVVAVCPGYVPQTNLIPRSPIEKAVVRFMKSPLLRATKQAISVPRAAAVLEGILTEETKKTEPSGSYLDADGKLAESSEESRNEELCDKLWTLSGGLLRIDGFEAVEIPEVEIEENKDEEAIVEVEKKEVEATEEVTDVIADTTEDVKADAKEEVQTPKKKSSHKIKSPFRRLSRKDKKVKTDDTVVEEPAVECEVEVEKIEVPENTTEEEHKDNGICEEVEAVTDDLKKVPLIEEDPHTAIAAVGE